MINRGIQLISVGLTYVARWLFHIAQAVVRPSGRSFTVLTPPMVATQLIKNRATGKKILIHLRDAVDVATLYQVFVDEEYRLERIARAPEYHALYQSICDSGKTPLIIDCGANIGLASIYLNERFPLARVVGLEPDTSAYLSANRNCEGRPAITLLNAGVSSQTGFAHILDPGLGGNAMRTVLDDSGDIELKSISDIRDAQGDQFELLFVKMDVEGAEKEIFSRDVEWIDEVPLLIVELHDWMLPKSANSRSFLVAHATRDRDFIFMGENVFSCRN